MRVTHPKVTISFYSRSVITISIGSEEDMMSRNEPTKAEETLREQDNEDEYSHMKFLGKKDILEMFKRMGNYMREFSPFYELKSMMKLYTPESIKKKTDDIVITVEMGLRSVRSAQNKNTKLKKDRTTMKTFEALLDILEDEAAGRFGEANLKALKKKRLIEVRKLMPPEYKVDVLPSHFNYFDSERIKTMVLDK